jgi:hypothetical protein
VGDLQREVVSGETKKDPNQQIRTKIKMKQQEQNKKHTKLMNLSMEQPIS